MTRAAALENVRQNVPNKKRLKYNVPGSIISNKLKALVKEKSMAINHDQRSSVDETISHLDTLFDTVWYCLQRAYNIKLTKRK